MNYQIANKLNRNTQTGNTLCCTGSGSDLVDWEVARLTNPPGRYRSLYRTNLVMPGEPITQPEKPHPQPPTFPEPKPDQPVPQPAEPPYPPPPYDPKRPPPPTPQPVPTTR